jgi:glycosyltransferase involved in cell wall biosynthesis
VTRTIANRYAEHFPQWAGKVRLLYNGFDPEDFPPTARAGDGPFTIVHTGSFYPHTPPSTLLAAVERLLATGGVARGGLRVELLGRPEPVVQQEIRRRGLEGVVLVRGFRPLREAVEAAARADLQYLLLPAHFQEALSDKVFTYLATGNPILAEIPEGECRSFLREWGDRMSFVVPGDVDGMRSAIAAALTERRVRPTESSRLVKYRATFDREAQARQLAEILEGIA